MVLGDKKDNQFGSSMCKNYWYSMNASERERCRYDPIGAISEYHLRKLREAEERYNANMNRNDDDYTPPSPPAEVSCDKKCIAVMVAYVGGIIASFLILNLLAHMLGINPFAVMP